MMTSEILAEAYAPLKRAADEGRVKLLDLGVSRNADGFWFNLRPGAFGQDPRASWLQRDELRRAISMAVDRKLFADTVFFGAGVPVYGPETPANKIWYWPGLPQMPHDPAAAKQLLASIGLADRNGDGLLEDAQNRPARFTLLTQKGRPNLERGAAVIRDELKKIGLTVDVVDARRRRGDRPTAPRAVRGALFQRRQERSRSGHEPRLLVQLRQRAHVEPRREDAGDRLGTAD